MNCERTETRLIAHLDARPGLSDRREVEAHLAACNACRTRAEEFRLLWGVLDEVPLTEASPAFDACLRARLASEPPRQNLWAGLVPAPRLAFALTLLLLVSVYISMNPQGSPETAAIPSITPEAEFRMIRDLPVLENYDVLANFEALSELPPRPAQTNRDM